MGKRGRGGKAGGGSRESKAWSEINMATATNKAFLDYYKAQGVLAESEWDDFIASLRVELPLTFRVTGSRANAETINEIIKSTYVPNMQEVELDGQRIPPPEQIPWYPGGLAWQLQASKRIVRKSPPFKTFQQFLVGETEVGNLSRQEAVSMIPPLFLNVEPHHRCLDMCAAPGSKTAQIIEALNPHHTESTGMLLANDSDYKRTHMLVHQTSRMPSKGLIVTNNDASMLPNIKLDGGKTLLFDRILADVPCSGDGTLRKNVEIWAKWTAADGNSLHSLQLRILQRGMQILAPGGRLVYSTCSFNPAEDEAVIAAALNEQPGEFSIVDVSADYPELKRRPGMTSWKVATQPAGKDTDLVWHESFQSYRKRADAGDERDKDKMKGIPETVWAPENIAELGMEKAMRLFPHDQNTGGFFVCVLERAGSPGDAAETTEFVPSPPPVEETTVVEDAIVADETGTSTLKRELSPSAETGPETAKKSKQDIKKEEKRMKRDPSWKEDPFSFVDVNHKEVGTIVEWFKLQPSFRTDQFLVRNDTGEPLRTIYLSNPVIKSILQNNDSSRLRVVSAGVKGFVRQDSQARTDIQCKWRIPNEGMLEVLPHVGEGVVREVTLRELKIFVGENYPTIDMFAPEVSEWMEASPLGNMLFKVLSGDSEGGQYVINLPLPLFMPIWRAKTSMSLLIDKREKSMLSLRIFGADITKPHTATVRTKPAEAGDNIGTNAAPATASDSKPTVDEEAAQNA